MTDTDTDTAPGFDAEPDLDSFRAPPLEPGADIGDDVQEWDADADAPAEPAIMDKEQFWEVFQLAFSMPGAFVPALQPVAIQPNEQTPARAASDATHRLLEIWAPQLLQPGNETVGLLLAALPFWAMKAATVRGCLADMRAEKRAAMERAQAGAANTNAAPDDAQTSAAPDPTDWMAAA